MVKELGIEESKIGHLSDLLYKNYGTTMAGLRVYNCLYICIYYFYLQIDIYLFLCLVYVEQGIGYEFDYDKYHAFIHGRLPYERLKPDPVLRNLLLSLPIRKLVSFLHNVVCRKFMVLCYVCCSVSDDFC